MVWHHSLLLMNSFNKTEAAVFSCRLCFLRAFPFISLVKKEYIPIYSAPSVLPAKSLFSDCMAMIQMETMHLTENINIKCVITLYVPDKYVEHDHHLHSRNHYYIML